MAEIKVISAPSQSQPFAVIFKPAGLASAPLQEGDDSALTQAVKLFPQLKQVIGRKVVEYGLLHRIDTATTGILLIASTQQSYENLLLQQKNGEFVKYYRAQVEYEGPQQKKNFTVTSRFRPFGPKGKEVRPVFENSSTADKKKSGSKIYTTTIELNGKNAVCCIKEGYRHQVRAHLAFSGYPIKGDPLYNPKVSASEKMMFEAFKFEFNNPADGKSVSFEY